MKVKASSGKLSSSRPGLHARSDGVAEYWSHARGSELRMRASLAHECFGCAFSVLIRSRWVIPGSRLSTPEAFGGCQLIGPSNLQSGSPPALNMRTL